MAKIVIKPLNSKLVHCALIRVTKKVNWKRRSMTRLFVVNDILALLQGLFIALKKSFFIVQDYRKTIDCTILIVSTKGIYNWKF